MPITRRDVLACGAAGTALAWAGLPTRSDYQGGRSPWPLCLDTATIRPQPLEKKIEVAARAGFDAIFQFNDAPAAPGLDELEDSDRVFPGDGILPLEACVRDLLAIGYERCISLELYNPAYWERDPLEVAVEGRDKTLAVIERALG